MLANLLLDASSFTSGMYLQERKLQIFTHLNMTAHICLESHLDHCKQLDDATLTSTTGLISPTFFDVDDV
jgi:hypothetical protein